MPTERHIPATHEIAGFIHCHKCLEERNNDAVLLMTTSPRTYASLEVGFTKLGLQIWCKRHECNVMHIDFQGHKHPANMDAEDSSRLPDVGASS